MGKRKRNQKQRQERLAELLQVATENGVRVHMFSPIHCRLFGKQTVDYWPTTGRMWFTGTKRKAEKMWASAAVAAALSRPPMVVEQEAAESHMRSISDDPFASGEVPW